MTALPNPLESVRRFQVDQANRLAALPPEENPGWVENRLRDLAPGTHCLLLPTAPVLKFAASGMNRGLLKVEVPVAGKGEKGGRLKITKVERPLAILGPGGSYAFPVMPRDKREPAPRDPMATRECPECKGEMTWAPEDDNYGADADGNRGTKLSAAWGCECGHVIKTTASTDSIVNGTVRAAAEKRQLVRRACTCPPCDPKVSHSRGEDGWLTCAKCHGRIG